MGIELSLDFCGITLEHPVINGSGTFDAIAARRAFGEELVRNFPFSAFVSKTITVEPRAGNPPPRLWETPAGMINSIGLPNKGLKGFLEHDLPELSLLSVPLIVSVMGTSHDEFAALVEGVGTRPEVAAMELNVSCPNVESGLIVGEQPPETRSLLEALRPITEKPLIVKLTPNVADPAAVARAAEEGGADALARSAIRLRPLFTPGHTPHHLSYEIIVGSSILSVLSGGSLLVGAVGRTDLISPEQTEALTRQQYRSAHKIGSLPEPVVVGPTHGGGSFCTSSPASDETWTTVGQEKRRNPALLAADEASFIRQQLEGLGPYPAYYAEMGPINRDGSRPWPGRPLEPLSAARVQELVAGDRERRDVLARGEAAHLRVAAEALP